MTKTNVKQARNRTTSLISIYITSKDSPTLSFLEAMICQKPRKCQRICDEAT